MTEILLALVLAGKYNPQAERLESQPRYVQLHMGVAGKDLTLVIVPCTGHWVHQDMLEPISKTMRFWLNRDKKG